MGNDGESMNRKQLIVIWVAIGIIGVMVLFPPWYEQIGKYRISAGYEFIGSRYTTRLDWGRLLLPIAGVAIVAIGLFLSFRDKRPPS